MGIVTALGKLLLKEKKGTVGVVIKKIEATLGKEKTKKYLADTAYSRAASKSYAETMAKLKKKK